MSGAAVAVGGLPVSVTAIEAVGSADSVRVSTADPDVGRVAGVRGVVLSLSRTDLSLRAARVRLRVSSEPFAGLFGADFADRLRLVGLPSCVLSTPERPPCQAQMDLGSARAAGSVSAELTLPGSGGSVVVALTSESSSAGATFSATSLSPTYSWTAGGQGRSFSWQHPLTPPNPGLAVDRSPDGS